MTFFDEPINLQLLGAVITALIGILILAPFGALKIVFFDFFQ